VRLTEKDCRSCSHFYAIPISLMLLTARLQKRLMLHLALSDGF